MQIPLGAEVVGVGADDLEELEEDDDDYIRLGHEDEHEADFSKLQLKPDHQNRQAVLQPLHCPACMDTKHVKPPSLCISSAQIYFHCPTVPLQQS